MQQPVEALTCENVGVWNQNDELFRAFGPSNCFVETCTYKIAEKMFSGYESGFWEYWKISNGGFFATLKTDGPILVESVNGESHKLSAEAAGWLFGYGDELDIECKADCGSQDFVRALVRNYDNLREFAFLHDEREQIFAILD